MSNQTTLAAMGLGLVLLISAVSAQPASGQDPTGHGQSPSPSASPFSQPSRKDNLDPAGSSVREQFKTKSNPVAKKPAGKTTSAKKPQPPKPDAH